MFKKSVKSAQNWFVLGNLPIILIVFFTFAILPLIFSLYLSLTRFSLVLNRNEFLGLSNFVNVLDDPRFINASKNSLLYIVYFLPLSLLLSLLLAVAVNSITNFKGFYRLIYFLPPITSTVAASLIFKFVYDRNAGLLNQIIHWFNPAISPSWLFDKNLALLSISIMAIWQETGWNMVIFLAGLQGIPNEYYEAAQIDGANKLQAFFNVTWPLLRPTFVFVLITATIGAAQVFTPVYVMTQGGPAPYRTETLVFYIFNVGFKNYELGYAAALSVFLFIPLLVLAIIQYRFFQAKWEY
ncbi:MAG: sugar ABC transporter permease [Anaerolineaceae bacterium]|jgi:multiple sugar transport system permease protein